jgi:hypothetical protein
VAIDILAIAKQVYGEHTNWSGIQLARLQLLAEKIIEADRAQRKAQPLPAEEKVDAQAQ